MTSPGTAPAPAEALMQASVVFGKRFASALFVRLYLMVQSEVL